MQRKDVACKGDKITSSPANRGLVNPGRKENEVQGAKAK